VLTGKEFVATISLLAVTRYGHTSRLSDSNGRLHILRAPRYDDLTLEHVSTAVWELLDFRSSLKCR